MTPPEREALVRAAIDTQSWDEVVAIIETHWADLTQWNRPALIDAVNALPPSVLLENPRLSAARTYVNYLPANGTVRPVRYRYEPAAPRQSLLDTLADLTSRSVSARFEGALPESVALVQEALARLGEVPESEIAAVRPVLPDIRVQWAITLELSGELVAANRMYEQTFDEALAVENERIATKSAGSIALNYALAGALSTAEQWLLREPQPASEDGGLHEELDTVRTTGGLARALLAANDLRFEDAAAALDKAPSGDVDRETWALRLYVESVLARSLGQSRQQLMKVSTTLGSQPELHRTTGLNGWLSATVIAELQLALGDVAAAHETTAQLKAYGPLTEVDPARVLRSWIALRRGDPRKALVIAAPGLSQPLTSPRVQAELLVVLAAASLAVDQLDNAIVHFDAAVEILVSEKLPIVLLRLTAEERAVLLQGHSAAFDERVMTELSGRETVTTAPHTVSLTKREKVVLGHIVQGLGPTDIAAIEHLSRNTVKGQVRTLYRKLGVSDREGALRAAIAAPHLWR